MWAHAALRRLLDVEFHRAAVGAVADRHPQPVPRRPGLPQGGHVQRAQAVDAEQRGERGVERERIFGQAPRRRGPQRGELPGQRFGLGER